MSRYERKYGAGWETLSRDEATGRAYAIGVAEKLGEYNREELEAVHAEMDTSYDRSMVELAYAEGRQEATAAAKRIDGDGDAVWSDLVEGEKVYVPPDESPIGGHDGLPKALEPSELLDRQSVDSTEPIERPDFLDK